VKFFLAALILGAATSSAGAATIDLFDPTGEGYPINRYDSPSVATHDLVMINIYEADYSPPGDYELKVANVSIEYSGPTPIAIALSAYNRVTWVFDIDPRVAVSEILVSGHEEQAVSGVGDIPTVVSYGPFPEDQFGRACGWFSTWPTNPLNKCTADVEAIEGLTSLTVTNFAHMYRASEITITSAGAVPVPAAIWLFGSAIGFLGWIGR